MDVSNAYNQSEIREKDKQVIAFTTRKGVELGLTSRESPLGIIRSQM